MANEMKDCISTTKRKMISLYKMIHQKGEEDDRFHMVGLVIRYLQSLQASVQVHKARRAYKQAKESHL